MIPLLNRRRGDLTTPERQRLDHADETAAKLRRTIDTLKVQLATARNIIDSLRAARVDDERRRVEAEARLLSVSRELAALREAAAEGWEGPHPVACTTLAECSSNRSAAEKVTRVLPTASGGLLDEITDPGAGAEVVA